MAAETADTHGIDMVVAYLRERGVEFDVVDHAETMSAIEEASAAGVPPDHAAKTMILRDGDSYRIAVIPASHRLDVSKAREALGATRHLRLATEAEMRSDLGMFDVGAAPPLGPLFDAQEVLDRHLLAHERILCTGGDHRHSVLIGAEELARVAQAQIADVCED